MRTAKSFRCPDRCEISSPLKKKSIQTCVSFDRAGRGGQAIQRIFKWSYTTEPNNRLFLTCLHSFHSMCYTTSFFFLSMTNDENLVHYGLIANNSSACWVSSLAHVNPSFTLWWRAQKDQKIFRIDVGVLNRLSGAAMSLKFLQLGSFFTKRQEISSKGCVTHTFLEKNEIELEC